MSAEVESALAVAVQMHYEQSVRLQEALAALEICATAIDVAIQEREFLGKEPWVYDRYALKQARAVLKAAENG